MAPAPGVKVTLTLFSGTLASGGTTLTVGSLDTTPQPAVNFTISNSNNYAEGLLTIQNSSLTNTCHVDFQLSGTSWCWKPHPQSGDNASALPTSPTNNVLGVGNPTDNGNNGTASRYQVLNSNMVYLVDYNPTTGNMFFRGNLPFTSGSTPTATDQRVDFDRLHTIMNTRFQQQVGGNTSFPTKGNYTLMDISVISMASEGEELFQEYQSFGGVSKDDIQAHTWFPTTPYTSPDGYLAQMMWWQLEPNLTNTNANTLATQLSTLMNTPGTNGPNIYYMHCTSGHDRTALGAVSYFMAHRQMPISEAFVYGTTVTKLPASMKNTQIIPTVCNMGTTTVNTEKSRIMPIAEVYNNTMVDVCNDLGGTNCTLSNDATCTTPNCFVYADFPWEGNSFKHSENSMVMDKSY